MLIADPILDAPEPARRAFVACMRRVMEADGVWRRAEQAALERLSRELRVPGDAEVDDLSALLPLADHVVVQAAWVAGCDGAIAVAEREVVEALEAELDATPGLASQALAWAERGAAWLEEGRRLAATAGVAAGLASPPVGGGRNDDIDITDHIHRPPNRTPSPRPPRQGA